MKCTVWKRLTLRFGHSSADSEGEVLSGILGRYDHCGISEIERGDAGEWSVYFEADKYPEGLAERLPDLAAAAGVAGVQVAGPSDVPQENWHSAWREYFQPVTLSPGVRVCPPWLSEGSREGMVEIVIEPGMAFGTGTHATTQLCLRLAEQCIRGGITVLDIGTGSGILCIAAVKLGARHALGFDNDLDVRENAAENLRLNGVADGRVQIYVGGIEALSRGARFDLVLCNMLSNQFLPLVGAIAGVMEHGGRVVFSGFLASERDAVIHTLSQAGLECVAMETLDEWGGLVARQAQSA